MHTIEIILSEEKFISDLEQGIQSQSSLSTYDIIAKLVKQYISTVLLNFQQNSIIERYNVYWRNPEYRIYRTNPSLKTITNLDAFDLGYYIIDLVTDLNPNSEIEVVFGENLENTGYSKLSTKKLRTIRKWKFRFYSISINSILISKVYEALGNPCSCDPNYLFPYISGVWDNTLQFICRVCGKSYICECFRKALIKEYKEIVSSRPLSGDYINRLVKVYETSEFRENICHLCRNTSSELRYCHPQYGSNVLVHYGPYIHKIAIEENIDQKEAENIVRGILGIPRIGEGWVSEVELLNIFREIFANESVIHQARPDWLGLQRLDIYLPKRSLAIEYQGRQHYEPVEFFGGIRGFEKTQNRDNKKAELCKSNNVKLIYFNYDEPISKNYVISKLRDKGLL